MKEELLEAGLTEREAQAYLELFNFEETTATELAKVTKEHRTNIYDSLNGLIKKGLISFTIKNNVKYYKVTEPQNLLDFLKEKEDKIQRIIPELQKKLLIPKEKPSVEVYEGKEGFKAILNKMIREKKTIFGIGASEEWDKRFPIKLSQYMKLREENQIKAKLLYVKGTKPTTHRLNEIKILPTEFQQPSTIAIFGDYVAVFMWTEPLVATLTKSKELSKSFEKYFELLWKIAEK
jgi:sugar-specific transcriptional regulator TrmB